MERVSRGSSNGFGCGQGYENFYSTPGRSFYEAHSSLVGAWYLMLRLGLLLAAEAHDSTTAGVRVAPLRAALEISEFPLRWALLTRSYSQKPEKKEKKLLP